MTTNNDSEFEIAIPEAASAGSLRVKRYGEGANVVVLSNMDPEADHEWAAFIEAADTDAYAVLTYSYPQGTVSQTRALEALLDYLEGGEGDEGKGVCEKIVLIGSGYGAAASLQAAARRSVDYIAGIVAISAPQGRDGERMYSDGDLRMIIAPKLFVCSEFDDLLEESRSLFAVVEDPRRFTLYPGDASGSGILAEHGESLSIELLEFIAWAFHR